MAKIDKDVLQQDVDTAMQKFMLAVKAAARKAAPDLSGRALAEIGEAARKSAFTNLLLNSNLMHHFAVAAVSHSRDPKLAEGRPLGTAALVEKSQKRRDTLSRAIMDYIKNNTEAALLGRAKGITDFIMSKHANSDYARATVLQQVKREMTAFRLAQKDKK